MQVEMTVKKNYDGHVWKIVVEKLVSDEKEEFVVHHVLVGSNGKVMTATNHSYPTLEAVLKEKLDLNPAIDAGVKETIKEKFSKE